MFGLKQRISLYKAIQNKEYPLIGEFIEKDIKLSNTKLGPQQSYPIEIAASNNDMVCLNYFLQSADEEKIWLAILAAVRNGCLDTFTQLYACSPKFFDGSRYVTPKSKQKLIHYAAIYGQINILLALKDLGFDLSEPIECPDSPDHRKNVLQLAMENEKEECALTLYLHGFREFNYNDRYVWSFIHMAAAKGYLSIIMAYFNNGGRLGILDRNNQSLLLWAASTGQIEVMRYLIDNKVEINSPINDEQGYRCAPIFWAVVMGQTEAVKLLLNAGAKFDFVCWEYHHPKDPQPRGVSVVLNASFFAFGLYALGVVSPWLIIPALFVDINVNNNLKYTLLHIAAREGYLDIVKELCIRCSPEFKSQKNRDKKTALDFAEAAHHTEIVDFLKFGDAASTFFENSDINSSRYVSQQLSRRPSFYKTQNIIYLSAAVLGFHARLFQSDIKKQNPKIIVESRICSNHGFDSQAELMREIYAGEYRTEYFPGSLKNKWQGSVRFIRPYFEGDSAIGCMNSLVDTNRILKALEAITRELIRIHLNGVILNHIDFKKIILKDNGESFKAVFIDFSKSEKEQKSSILSFSKNQKVNDILLYAQKLEEFLYLHPQGVDILEDMPALEHFIEDCNKKQKIDIEERLRGLFSMTTDWVDDFDGYGMQLSYIK